MLTFSEKCAWARKAVILDTEKNEDHQKFRKISKESGLGEKQLTYYSNAYEAAGESGIKALSRRKRMPTHIREKALSAINIYLSQRVKAHLKAEIGFLVKAQHNRITVSEKRPLFSDPSQTSCSAIFQVRYTTDDNRWHLYWMRVFHKWWPYIPRKPIYTIADCLRELSDDSYGCFWG